MRKGHMKSPCVSWRISSGFSFCEGKTRFSRAIAANKRANSHNIKTKNLNLLTITFLADYLMNKGKSSYINLSSMRVNNTSVRSLTVFEENIVVIVLAKLVLLFFKNLHALPNWQVSDCDRYLYNNVSKFVWKSFKSLLSLRKWKCPL